MSDAVQSLVESRQRESQQQEQARQHAGQGNGVPPTGTGREELPLGSWLRDRRKEAGLNLKDVAARTGFTPSYISQVERNVAAPSVAAFKKLANAVGTTVSAYFNSVEAKGTRNGRVVRNDRRKVLYYPGSQIRNELLCPDLSGKVELLWVVAPAGGDSGDQSFVHEGEEAAVVLQGTLEITIGDQVEVLEAGDSIYFNSTIPHNWRNAGNGELQAIWMETPPSF